LRRGRRLDWAQSPRLKQRLRLLLGLLLALFGLDLALPPPLHRAAIVSPVVEDAEGAWLRAFATREQKWRLAAQLDRTDQEFLRRLIAIEDERFWLHPGVDPIAVARAGLSFARKGEATSGASTLTMQTARLLEPRPRTIPSKLIEMVRALQIERRLTKREILALYLTLTPYGGNLEGVRAASRAYFGRDPTGLSDAEMALLIALPQAPEARRPDRRPKAARAARDAILAKFRADGFITARLESEAAAAAMPARQPFPIRADLVSERIIADHPGAAVIGSTIDARLQTTLAELARQTVEPLGPDVSGAILAVRLKDRAVRASIGGVGWDRAGGYIDMTRAVRSPGSTLKPFIYALAFDDGIAAPDTLIEDTPRRFSGYLPENFDRRFHGELRVSEALMHSLNLPAVATLERVGAGRFEAVLTRAGAKPRFPRRAAVEPGLALALGGVGMTLEELAMLYAALGDDGLARPLKYVPGPDYAIARRVMKPETAARVLSILAATPTPKGRLPAALARDAPQIAFKTGTSYGFRDAWAIGVGSGHVIAVWVGRPDGAPRPDATGRSEALPLLFAAFDRLNALGAPVQRFAPLNAAAAPGLRRFGDDEAAAGPAILFPPHGADVLVDGLGADGRGLSLAARGGRAPLTWYAEGRAVPLEATSGRAIWKPTSPGFHDVMVVDANGRRATAQVRVRDAR
jgi:penicillin-binding protein 1C